MHILVTGGAGYIGSHTCVSLLEAGHEVTVIDNFCNSSEVALQRVEEICGKSLRIIRGDVRNREDLDKALSLQVDSVIHFAALKAVGESGMVPLEYFSNNISGSIELLRAMAGHGVFKIVFSSSATVYGEPDTVPVCEDAPLRVINPYGRTKLVVEELIQDWCSSCKDVSAVLLRYFNPVGAHPSGRIGEDPRGRPNNLVPFVAQVAAGRRERLQIFGGDYPTLDGTGIRDYLHVVDLADAHLKAVSYSFEHNGCSIFNLGTGRGYSVMEVVRMFEAVSGRSIALDVVGRRKGDVAELTADPNKAKNNLGWVAEKQLFQMCADTWRWQSSNPLGYSMER